MKTSKSYIPTLITIALVSLIGLQVVWLFFVYEFKVQELKNKTRDALLVTTEFLQQEEDEKLIVQNLDSLILNDDSAQNNMFSEKIELIVSNIKNKIGFDSLNLNTQVQKELIIINDSPNINTKIVNNKNRKVIIHTESKLTKKSKKKAKDLESLFWKMAVNAEEARKDIATRVDTIKLIEVLNRELLKRGIELNPEVSVSYFPKKNRLNTIDNHILFSTTNNAQVLKSIVTMPLFPNDFFEGDLLIKVGYLDSTKNFVMKQMANLLFLSLIITLLIGFVMIYIFRRMLSNEKLNKIKNDFINNITHELKTPLATISLANSNIASVASKQNTSNILSYTQIINEENKKLNDHIEKVFELSLLEKEKHIINNEIVNIHEVIKDSINQNISEINEKRATIKLLLVAEKNKVKADKFHLTNIISNLIDNALKYSTDTILVVISTKNQGDKVTISVKDNGIGINKSQQKIIFDKFYRITNKNIHTVKGFGIGLSYIKQIVELFKGTIEVKSKENEGAEFIITLSNVKS